MESKVCTKCKEEKELSEFYKNKNYKDGYVTECKSCVIKNQRQWELKNRDSRRKYKTDWQRNNTDKSKEYRRSFEENNPNRASQLNKKWRDDNREAVRMQARHRYWINIGYPKETIPTKEIVYSISELIKQKS